MSGIRQSFVFCKEETFCGGKADDSVWIAPPPGSFLSVTHNRNVTKIYTEGSKFFDTLAYGQLSGSWEWTFNMDYDYLEPFALAFDKVGMKSSTTVNSTTGEFVRGSNTFTFSKENNTRVPSFCIRRKIINNIANGRYDDALKDETSEVRGCVVKSIRFSKSAGASQIQVSMSGFYADEKMDYDTKLADTDYQEYVGSLVEFSCMFIGGIAASNYVANTESLSVGIENSAAAIYTTCSPIASNYSESQTSVTFGTMAYSNDPQRYKTRLYSGGYDKTAKYPHHKGLMPIEEINLVSYSSEVGSLAEGGSFEETDGFPEENALEAAYNASDRTAVFTLHKTAIKSLTWQKGDGSKLQDQINSTDCQKVVLTVKTPFYAKKSKDDPNGFTAADDFWGTKNPHSVIDKDETGED